MMRPHSVIAGDNPVRVIDLFVKELYLARLGFCKTTLSKEGRPLIYQTLLSDWFLLLPGYHVFNNRLNKMHYCLEILVQSINFKALQQLELTSEKLIDSMPIIVTDKSGSPSEGSSTTM